MMIYHLSPYKKGIYNDAVYQRAIRIVQNKYIVRKDILTNEIKRHNFVLLCSSVSLLLK